MTAGRKGSALDSLQEREGSTLRSRPASHTLSSGGAAPYRFSGGPEGRPVQVVAGADGTSGARAPSQVHRLAHTTTCLKGLGKYILS